MTATSLAHALLPHPALAAVAALVAAAAFVALNRWFSVRAVRQPLAMALEAEDVTLAAVLAQPRRYPYICTISATDFAAGVNARIWTALLSALGPDAVAPKAPPTPSTKSPVPH